ncbi:ATP-binding protein [Streptomyces sp. NPDC003374]
MTRARLTGWSVCEDTCDTAALVVSELVTNAIVHTASSQIVCEVHDGDDLVRIAVRDEGCAPDEPHPSPRRPEEEHGRGLLLVDALCRAWGAQEQGAGLVVWAELERGAAAPLRSDAARDGRTAHADVQEALTGHADAHEALTGRDDAHLARTAHAGPHEALHADAHEVRTGRDGAHHARADLGWGARPKPGPVRTPGDDERQARRAAVPEQSHRTGAAWL